MPILLGIDTGGTYTDAVLMDENSNILATAKSPTTRENLSIGIGNALHKIFPHGAPHIHLVSLSSTLATNAVVEGKGSPAGLILIGYDPDILETDAFQKIRLENPVIFIKGGHRISGDEQSPLDEKGLTDSIRSQARSVAAFAVSSFFSVRNPSHELLAREIIREITGLPVTCGHELTSSLDAPRRAVTALLNARLIPLIDQLIRSVQQVLSGFKIHAPLMIVKGDGSLISAKVALDFPIETILSGPAASIMGARYLTGLKDAIIIDMGGTTADMAVCRGGSVKIRKEGASVGGFRPMVESIDILTQGIGGDSWLRPTKTNGLKVGPMRVLPLCILGHQYPEIINTLNINTLQFAEPELPLFIFKQASASATESLPGTCKEILDRVSDKPLFVPQLLEKEKYPSVYAQSIQYLMKEGMIGASSFTPTDAVHILGLYQTGSAEAARLGAAFIAAKYKMDMEAFCKMAVVQVQYDLSSELIRCALRNDDVPEMISAQSADSFFLDRALRKQPHRLINCSLSMTCPIVAVGAPAGTYLPEVSRLFGCELFVPEYADVSNAIGAVTGVISQAVQVLIKPRHGGASFRVYTPEGMVDFQKYQDAETHANRTAERMARDRARTAGADKIEIDFVNKKIGMNKDNPGDVPEILVQTEITAVAIGRPRMGEG